MWGCSMRFSWIMERPPSAPPKEGSTSLGHLLKRRNKFVCMLITFISSKIFLDILGCRLRQGGLKCKEKRANGNLPRPLPRRGARAWSLFLRHEMNLFVCSCPLYLLKFSTIFLDVACDEEAKTARGSAPNGNLPRPLPRRGARVWSIFLGNEMNLFVS